MTDAPASPPKKASRGLKITLVASLALNLLLIGIAVGSAFHHHRAPFGPRMSLHHLTDGLPEDARRTVDSIMAAHRDRIRALAGDLKKQQRSIADLLRAETIDDAALDQAFKNIQTLNAELQNEIHLATREAVEKLPVDVRRELTKRMMRGLRYRHKEFDDEMAPPPPPPDEDIN